MIEITNLHQALINEGYFCDIDTAIAVEASLHTRPTAGAFLYGPAGTGKTYLPECLARVLGRPLFFYQCFPGTREDDLLVKLIPDDKSQSGIKAVDGVVLQAAKTSLKKPAILVLDEWDKTRPSADSFLLDFLQTGRINFNGRSCKANLQNLTVFVSLNDERELSEPLLRRLPLIQFNHLPTHRVREALNLSHPDHPYISAALVLYERCLIAGMSKPATIQELRQLLDAITLLGDNADWDSLVFQFITKTKENHALLKGAEGSETETLIEEREKLDPQAYVPLRDDYTPVTEALPPALPKIPSIADEAVKSDTTPDLSEAGGVLELTDAAYDAVVGIAGDPADDPKVIGQAGRVVGDKIVINKPFMLADYDSYRDFIMLEQEGEILLLEPYATLQDILKLRPKFKIVKYSASEVLAKKGGVDLRWTPENGAEIIVNIKEGGFRKLVDAGIVKTDYFVCSRECGKTWRVLGCDRGRCGGMDQRQGWGKNA